MSSKSDDPRRRFEKYIFYHPFDDCWLWMGPKKADGYGEFYISRKMILAHRFAWELYRGEIPDGLLVCHHCDTPQCVNPMHLFLGTNMDNMRDMYAKNRRPPPRGERNGMVKLTRRDVAAIRSSSETQMDLARKFNMSQTQISRIKRAESWRHI